MFVQIDPRSHVPIWEQIVIQMKELILRGLLATGDKVPSVRELAGILVVNPNTVSKAYKELENQGIIETLRGRGTFVKETFDKVTINTEKVNLLRDKTKQLIIEGSYVGVTSSTFKDWIDDIEEELGGSQHD